MLSGSVQPLRSPRYVLIVDDNDEDIAWISELIAEASLGQVLVSSARCLSEAAGAVRATPPDVVIADFHLPDGTGIELAEELRHVAPVIVITGQEQPEQSGAMITRGATEFLVKDELTAKDLARACANAIARSRLEQEVRKLREAEQAATQREREARQVAELALKEEQRGREQLTALLDLASALGAALKVAQVASIAAPRICSATEAEAVSIYSVDKESTTLRLRSQHGFERELIAGWDAIPLTARTPLTDAARSGALTLSTSSGAPGSLYGGSLSSEHSWLTLPIRAADTIIGVVGFKFRHGHEPGEQRLGYITLVGSMIGQAMRRAQLLEQAEANAEFEERLLAVLGHDLRSPLDVISLSTGLLRLGAEREPVLGRIERAVGTMRDLIADILARTVRRRGTAPDDTKRGNFIDVVTTQIEDLRTANPRRDIRLESEDSADSAPYLCDTVRLNQIVANLVRNALHHGDPHTPVAIVAKRGPNGAEVSVTNQGPEIAPHRVDSLFQPFVRGAESRGSGLGLYIVHELVTEMGGTISVSSAARTTCFRVQLPEAKKG